MDVLEKLRALAARQAEIAAEMNTVVSAFADDELGEEMLAAFAADAARRASIDMAALVRRMGSAPFAGFVGRPSTIHRA